VKDAELKLAQQLIEQQASETFNPGAYTDEVRARVEAAVQKKVEGQEVTMAEAPQPSGQVIDLMEALRASLEKKPAKRAQPAAQPAKAARKAAKK
jgi:DNA end-binding protein Ku